jgi:hypothetical protein
MAVVQRRWCEARRLLADLQPDTAESVVTESVVQASDVVDRRQAAPHTQRDSKLGYVGDVSEPTTSQRRASQQTSSHQQISQRHLDQIVVD